MLKIHVELARAPEPVMNSALLSSIMKKINVRRSGSARQSCSPVSIERGRKLGKQPKSMSAASYAGEKLDPVSKVELTRSINIVISRSVNRLFISFRRECLKPLNHLILYPTYGAGQQRIKKLLLLFPLCDRFHVDS